jgi:hypothetical protein
MMVVWRSSRQDDAFEGAHTAPARSGRVLMGSIGHLPFQAPFTIILRGGRIIVLLAFLTRYYQDVS